jgi:hypothetical protein
MAEAEKAVAKIHALGHPVMSNAHVQPWSETLKVYDKFIVDGRRVFEDGRWLPRLTPAIIHTIVEAANDLPAHGMIILHDLQGAVTRIDCSASAFAYRTEHLIVELMAFWDNDKDSTEGQKNIQ